MEFTFDVNKILPKSISKITHTLIPEDFRGDRHELLECQRRLNKIVDDMGEASARAQGLNKPITSTLKLRDTDHIIYLLLDQAANKGLGSVVGLLKTGSKNLFMFDELGNHYQLKPRCVLDFYIHESRQRMGFGNILYQHMLAEENVTPVKLAIDRPSDKFLAFLHKYYNLSTIIPQNNKFVVFQGFFDDENQASERSKSTTSMKKTQDNVTPGVNYIDINRKNSASSERSSYGMDESQNSWKASRYGRYAAARPPCSMANIIHNSAMISQKQPAQRNGDEPPSSPMVDILPQTKLQRPRSLSLYSNEELKERTSELSVLPTPIAIEPRLENTISQQQPPIPDEIDQSNTENPDKDTSIKPSPTCGQEVTTQNSQHGHLDLKFYHSPLW